MTMPLADLPPEEWEQQGASPLSVGGASYRSSM